MRNQHGLMILKSVIERQSTERLECSGRILWRRLSLTEKVNFSNVNKTQLEVICQAVSNGYLLIRMQIFYLIANTQVCNIFKHSFRASVCHYTNKSSKSIGYLSCVCVVQNCCSVKLVKRYYKLLRYLKTLHPEIIIVQIVNKILLLKLWLVSLLIGVDILENLVS